AMPLRYAGGRPGRRPDPHAASHSGFIACSASDAPDVRTVMNNHSALPAMDRLMAEKVPGDSRQARQLARRQMIAEAVMAEGTMRIEDLTERFGISLMTAHRDLDDLVSRGLLRKMRGMVSAAPTSLVEASDVYRSIRQSAEKAAIAEVAFRFVEPGQAIFMDDSTSVLQMARLIPEKT